MVSMKTRCFLLLLVCLPTPAFAQSKDPCPSLQEAYSRNQRVRLRTVTAVVEGRISMVRCPTDLRIGTRTVAVPELRAIDTRISRPDPLGNGIALGALAGGVAGAVVAPLSTGGDASFIIAGLGGIVTGALAGFVIDVAREKPGEWVRAWTLDR
jgi:hypothetical protein